jgi:hypothetical protein
MSAVRPRSLLSPLQVGLSVTLHKKFGSEKIIDIRDVLEMRGQILTTSWLHVELGKNIFKILCQKIK